MDHPQTLSPGYIGTCHLVTVHGYTLDLDQLMGVEAIETYEGTDTQARPYRMVSTALHVADRSVALYPYKQSMEPGRSRYTDQQNEQWQAQLARAHDERYSLIRLWAARLAATYVPDVIETARQYGLFDPLPAAAPVDDHDTNDTE